jgi:2-(3-amino-3-carboxypropyl)histidine synthase
MRLHGYDLDLESRLPRIREEHPGLQVVGLQFPDGLRDHATDIAAQVEEGLRTADGRITAVISADPCYGACDLCDDEMAKLGVTVLIHFGHTEMPSVPSTNYGVHVYFVPARSTHPVEQVVEEACMQFAPDTKVVGLCTTAQHVHKLPDAAKVLEAHGYTVQVTRGDDRTAAAGQLLGCNVMAATRCDADEFLFLGSGDFHPLALALETHRRIIAADPYSGTVHSLDGPKHRILKQRYAAIGLAKTARRFGIIVSTKGGQMRFHLARRIRDKLEAHGKEAFIIQDKQISPQDLLYFRHLDAFVGVACPRVPIDDQGRYDKPFLTPQELDIVLGLRPADKYVFDTYTAKSR